MMKSFVFDTRLPRVLFADGSLEQMPDEVALQGGRRVLVLCTPQQTGHAARVSSLLGPQAIATFDQAVMHVPVATVDAAAAVARAGQVDLAVAIGGGSTIGLAKALALRHDLPFIAIPTTYAGSEMTSIYGITDAGMKRTGRDPKVLARAVLYDPSLTLDLPLGMSVVSGLNAIAHAAEALYATDGNPVISLMAEEGVRAVAAAIASLPGAPNDPTVREQALYGAWLCGTVLGNTSMGLHHKLCHALGGTFDLPHAELHAVILPHALAYNAGSASEAMSRLARALGHIDPPDVASCLFDLAHRCGAPSSLREIGMKATDLDRAAELVMQQRYPNPRALESAAVRELLQHAFDGVPPA
jgi:maleylacetate reductase